MKKLLFVYNLNHFRVDLSEDNTRIYSSYKVKTRKDIKRFLVKLQAIDKHKEFAISKRSLLGMVLEWRAHNTLYNLHLFRSHTKDVDLEYPQKWYMKVVWFCLGIF